MKTTFAISLLSALFSVSSAFAETTILAPIDDYDGVIVDREIHEDFGGGMRPGRPDDIHHEENLNLQINLGEREFLSASGADTVFLKALIQRQNPYLPLHMFDLKKVVVFAKSKFGRGQIQLLTGHELSYPQTIAGNPWVYNRYGFGFQRYVFMSHGLEGAGVWQLKINGNIKISRIVVELGERRMGHRPRF